MTKRTSKEIDEDIKVCRGKIKSIKKLLEEEETKMVGLKLEFDKENISTYE